MPVLIELLYLLIGAPIKIHHSPCQVFACIQAFQVLRQSDQTAAIVVIALQPKCPMRLQSLMSDEPS